jgi:hypothetical protein
MPEVNDTTVVFQIIGAELAPTLATAAAHTAAGGTAEADSSDEFQEEDLPSEVASGSDEQHSLCSSEGSAEHESAGGSSTDDGDVDEAAARAAMGTYVVRSNGYFTFTNNLAWPDVKVSIMRRWCITTELGTSNMSKTVTCANYGELSTNRARSFAVLTAWMLHRVKQSGWVTRRAARRRLFAQELESLERNLRRIPSSTVLGTGNALADKHIQLYCPELFHT